MKPLLIISNQAKLIDQLINQTQQNTIIKSFNLVKVHHLDNDAICLVRGINKPFRFLASKFSIHPYGNEAFLLDPIEAEGYHHV